MSVGAVLRGRLRMGTGVGLAAVVALLAVISLVWTPHGSVPAGLAPLAEPDTAHWLGTDATGRDVVSALMSATLTTLLLAWFATVVGLIVGLTVGSALAARFGSSGQRRQVLAGVVPAALGIGAICTGLQLPPALVVFLAISLPGSVVTAIGARAVLGPALAADFVTAARLAGLGWLGAVQRHVLPRVLSPLASLGLELLAAAVLVEVTLSFAGIGVDGSGLSLGTMLRDGQQLAQVRPLLVIVPGAVAVATALALHAVAAGLGNARDAAA